jgi:hypothetical protein
MEGMRPGLENDGARGAVWRECFRKTHAVTGWKTVETAGPEQEILSYRIDIGRGLPRREIRHFSRLNPRAGCVIVQPLLKPRPEPSGVAQRPGSDVWRALVAPKARE